ncbi:MAG: UDP-2,3-diacylglucosamine diphosphatase LpxI [Candidatus Omnitrophota bacterium]
MTNRIGLLAGNGRFPILFAKEAKKKAVEVIAIAINEETSKDLSKYVDKIYWLGVGELEKLFIILAQEKLTSIIMAGQVRHKLIFDKSIKLDSKMSELLGSVKNKKTDSLIGAVAGILESKGIKVLDSTSFLSDYLPKKGLLTRAPLDKDILSDIDFGLNIAKEIAGLDIGQSIVVKDKTVLAVESIEGTDEAIKRGAHYGREGIVVIKVSKPGQDMRFDVPVIGPETINLLSEVKAKAISIEANRTLIIDKDETLKLANDLGIGIIAV